MVALSQRAVARAGKYVSVSAKPVKQHSPKRGGTFPQKRGNIPPKEGERGNIPPKEGERGNIPPKEGERGNIPPKEGERGNIPPKRGKGEEGQYLLHTL